MLRTRKLKTISSFEIIKEGSRLQKIRLSTSQEGSILVGIIITMVVMATLGAGMVYLTTTSTLHELFANNNTRAYYAADSGGRYATALIRQTLAMGGQSVNDLGTSLNGTTFTMTNGDQFQITNWTPNLISNSWHFTYDSIGTVGSGFLQAKRRLTYDVHPANQGGVSPPPLIPPEASTFDLPKQDLDIYYSPIDMSEVDIKDNPMVGGDPALNLKADEYTMGLRWYANSTLAQLDAIRAGNGGLLSYGVQVQIDDHDEDTAQASPYNIIGISFRLDDRNDATTTDDPDNMYGISFVKLTKPTKANVLTQAPAWYKNQIHNNASWDVFSTDTNAGRWFVVLWKRIFADTSPTFTPMAYQKLIHNPTSGDLDSVCREGTANDCTKIEYWSTLMVYVEEITGANKIAGYLASPPTPMGAAGYERSTTDNPTTLKWAEKDGAPDTDNVPIPFQPISWTVVWGLWGLGQPYVTGNHVNVGGAAYICIADHTSTAGDKPGTGANWTTYWSMLSGSSFIQDSSLTTLNYNDYTIGDITQTKAREIGLHIFDMSTSAQNIFYDNLFIDLTPSGYRYFDGSGQVVQYP